MKRNKSILKRTAGMAMGLFALAAASCTSGFEQFNTNPDEAHKVDPSAFLGTMLVDIVPTSDELANEFQRACNLTGDIYSGYMAGIGDWGSSNGVNYNLYYLNGEWTNAAFQVAYTKVMAAWKKLYEHHEKGTLVEPTWAIAQIAKVATLHRITDIYGPIPYTEFATSVNPAYDSQEEVYKAMFADLDEAIAILKEVASLTERPLARVDYVYGGDYAKWLKYANSLKLRLAMRMVYANETDARRYAEEAVADGVMTSAADNATVKGSMIYNPLQRCWDMYNDCRMGAAMDSYMNGYKDPRLPKYFSEVGGGFHGVHPGLSGNNKNKYKDATSHPNVMQTDPVILMTAAECYFLRAEGALRKWEMGGEAQGLYEDGIKASFEQWGISDNSYLTGETLPARFEDVVGGDSRAALGEVAVAWSSETTDEKHLEQIITQKWIAMYPNGQEGWAEFRRTGYPKLFPVKSNTSNGTIDTQKQIRRLVFPQKEYDSNAAAVAEATKLLDTESSNPKGDTGATNLWWDKK